MKATELRGRTRDQLADQLLQLKKEQFNLRFQKATGQLEKSSRVNEVRKDIARVKPGRVIFEIDGVPVELAKQALTLAAAKLPIKTRFIQRIAE